MLTRTPAIATLRPMRIATIVILLLAAAASGARSASYEELSKAALTAFKAGELEKSLKHYRKAAKKAKTDNHRALAQKSIGVLLLKMGKKPGARESFLEASRLAPKNVTYLILLGLASEKPDDRISALERAVIVDPKNGLAAGDLGILYLTHRPKKINEAVTLLKRGATKAGSRKRRAEFLWKLSTVINGREEGDWELWARVLLKRYPKFKNNLFVQLNLGEHLFKDPKRRIKGARILRRACGDLEAKRTLINIFGEKTRRRTILSCAKVGQEALAESLLLDVLKKNYYALWPVEVLGSHYQSIGNNQNADYYYRRFLELTKKGERARGMTAHNRMIGFLYETQGLKAARRYYREMRDSIEHIARRHRDNPIVLSNHAHLLAIVGRDLARAEQISRGLLRRRVDNAAFILAEIYFSQGKPISAAKWFRKSVLGTDSVNPKIYWRWGKAHAAAGANAKAQWCWKEGLKINPSYRRLLQELKRKPPLKQTVDTASLPGLGVQKVPTVPTGSLEAGKQALEEGDLDGAVNNFESSLATAKTKLDRANALGNLSVVYFRLGERDKSVAAARAATKLLPRNAWMLLNEVNYGGHSLKKKLKILERAFAIEPSFSDLRVYLGRILSSGDLEDWNRVIEVLKPLFPNGGVGARPEWYESMKDLANAYHNTGRKEKAAVLYERLAVDFPSTMVGPAAALMAGMHHIENGRLENGVRLIGQACSSKLSVPPSPVVQQAFDLKFARICKKFGYYSIAQSVVTRLISKNPNHAASLFALYDFAYTRGDLERARELAAALVHTSFYLPGHLGLSRIAAEKGNTARAQAEARRGYEKLKPFLGKILFGKKGKGSEGFNQLAGKFLLLSGGDLTQAEALARKGVSSRGAEEDYGTLGEILIKQKLFSEAISVLERSRQLRSLSDPGILYQLGLAHRGIGDETKAGFVWREALRIDPHYRFIRAVLGKKTW
ncbi:MAG: hypothetical protein COB53_07655 [Elusimicrobia bacterium]|nr:MAG: hypothetical protein COB53_07655 [Elusimicrobiota bacterium]